MQGTLFQLILQADGLVKFVLLVLTCCSIFSWGIILYKHYDLTGAAKESAIFLQALEQRPDTAALLSTASPLSRSPIANVFRALAAQRAYAPSPEELRAICGRSHVKEAQRLQAYLIFLATTGSTSPFIGLFGTVWGIMNAFRSIGASGSASLAVVAPGIAEALITTAAGLAAAIPAVIAYNAYLSRTQRMIAEMEAASEQLLELMSPRRVA